MEEKIIKSGVILCDPNPKDYVSGGETGILYKETRPDGQWDDVLPVDEVQHGVYGDTSTCTNQSTVSSAETQIKDHLVNNRIPAVNVKKLQDAGFILSDGSVNLSERFNALDSGTDPAIGNYLYKPWESLRLHGIVPELDLPFPNKQRTPVFTVGDYFNKKVMTPELYEKAKIFLEVFDVLWEWGDTNAPQLIKNVKQAPLTLITACCSPWNTNQIIKKCDARPCHSTMLHGYELGNYWKDFDSYVPTRKKLNWDYTIHYSIKGVITPRSLEEKPIVVSPNPKKHYFAKALVYGMSRNVDIVALQNILKYKGFFSKKVLSTGNFFNITAQAVKDYQVANGIKDFANEKNLSKIRVGPKTIALLNKELYF